MIFFLYSTMAELEKKDGAIWQVIHTTLERVQDIQKGEGVDVVAAKA